MNFSLIVFILEMIGTVAFAVSGVLAARERRMDIFGAVVLGCATAVGGGLIRDLILGVVPPAMFQKPVYVSVAAAASLVFFCLERYGKRWQRFLESNQERNDQLLNIADSVGLAAFVAVGCRTAIDSGYADNFFLCAFVGVLTGIGGGILRDMLAAQMPLIMRKRVYGIAAIIGAVVYCGLLRLHMDAVTASVACMFITCLIRFLAIHYRWNLPSFR